MVGSSFSSNLIQKVNRLGWKSTVCSNTMTTHETTDFMTSTIPPKFETLFFFEAASRLEMSQPSGKIYCREFFVAIWPSRCSATCGPHLRQLSKQSSFPQTSWIQERTLLKHRPPPRSKSMFKHLHVSHDWYSNATWIVSNNRSSNLKPEIHPLMPCKSSGVVALSRDWGKIDV